MEGWGVSAPTFAADSATETPPGAWFVYGTDWNDYPIALFGDELEARRCADKQGYGEVVFWSFGLNWGDVRR